MLITPQVKDWPLSECKEHFMTYSEYMDDTAEGRANVHSCTALVSDGTFEELGQTINLWTP